MDAPSRIDLDQPELQLPLDRVPPIALVAPDLAKAVAWHWDRFHCEVKCQDDT